MVPSFIADSILNGIGSEEEELVMKHSALSMYAGGTDTVLFASIFDYNYVLNNRT